MHHLELTKVLDLIGSRIYVNIVSNSNLKTAAWIIWMDGKGQGELLSDGGCVLYVF